MGWLKDIWDGIVWFFRSLIEYIAAAIRELTWQFRYLRIKWTMDLAEWLEDDWNFMLSILFLIVGSFMLPSIVKFVSQIAGKVATAALLAFSVEQGITQRKLRFMLGLEALHDIAKILFPEYKAAMGELNKALSEFAKELKVGQGYIHSYLAMTRGVVSGTAAIMGMPPEIVEYEWWDKAVEWSSKIEARLMGYVRFPESIFGDIIEEIMIPLQETYTESQQKELNEIYTELERMNEIRNGIKLVESSLSTWIDEMPDEIQKVFDKKIGPVLADVREAMETLDNEVFNKIEAVVDRLQELETENARLLALMEEKKTDPLELVDQAALMNAREKEVFAEFVSDSLEISMNAIAEKASDEFIPDLDRFLPELPEEDEIISAILAISYDSPGIFIPSSVGRFGGESWFVGEY